MTNKAFPEALDELLQERGWSYRELSRRTREAAPPGLSHTSLSHITRGIMAGGLSMRAIETIAIALRVKPEHFAEYRLDQERERLNWRTQGLEPALRVLDGRGPRRPTRRT